MKKILIIIFLLINTNVFSAEGYKSNFTIEKFEEAKKNGAKLAITELVDKYYESSGTVTREELYSSWDGTNEIGQVQPPGTYLMHMESSNFQTGQTSTDIAPVVIGIKK